MELPAGVAEDRPQLVVEVGDPLRGGLAVGIPVAVERGERVEQLAARGREPGAR
ncbi:hypothetical protein SDC9_203692 [bioreactor metagenome]|uniref:Uncharacterized protein n=1 Tax=bioreactor metagenome TaxID=1076179 RepID=A0A645IX68_9ZZZZ